MTRRFTFGLCLLLLGYSNAFGSPALRKVWVKDTGCDAYMALESSDRFVAANRDIVRAFVAASIAGWRGYLTDPAMADAEILRRNPSAA